MEGAELVPCTVTEAVAVAPLGSLTVTVAVNPASELTLQLAVAAAPAAQPCHANVSGSPSGSDALACTGIEHGTPGRGWQLGFEAETVTVGGRFGCGVGVAAGVGVGAGAGVGVGCGSGLGVGAAGVGSGRAVGVGLRFETGSCTSGNASEPAPPVASLESVGTTSSRSLSPDMGA
jgi:hypothetical protein